MLGFVLGKTWDLYEFIVNMWGFMGFTLRTCWENMLRNMGIIDVDTHERVSSHNMNGT